MPEHTTARRRSQIRWGRKPLDGTTAAPVVKVRFTRADLDEIVAEADARGIPIAELVRNAVADYLADAS